VEWWPWGRGAFEEARRRNVPIFLSIGYSTCYWCHVMERESFEDAAIARRMNEGFVCVKVDREERPDVDDIYMAATQVLSGRGGWPMSAFLEPEGLRPFWCGTYFPPEDRHGLPGFPTVLEALSKAWRERPAEVREQAGSVAAAVREHLALAAAPVGLGLEQVSDGAARLLRTVDRVNGGFGGAPKFPQPVFLELLLDVRERAGDEATRDAIDEAARLTLDRMACGGMHDQVGGGFHRYSVDERWLVPHFEKMLYDNAQLGGLYARASALYGDGYYGAVARRTFDYVLREMTSPDGAFYSAQDAEVDGREGLNYLWTEEEVRGALAGGTGAGREDAEFALRVYGLDKGPNFRDPHHPGEPARNVLFLRGRPGAAAREMGIPEGEFLERLARVNARLYEVRQRRKQPRLDDKVLAGWNGMMVTALARGAVWLGEKRYGEAARRAAGFVLSRMRDPQRGLMRSWRGGRAGVAGFLEDYAFVIQAVVAIQDAARTAEPALVAAGTDRTESIGTALAEEAERLFGDPESGGYFDTREGESELFVRPRSSHDGAVPSGASAMLHGLLGLHVSTREPGHLERAVACLRSLSSAIAQSPAAAANATRGLLRVVTMNRAMMERVGTFGPKAAATAGGTPAPQEGRAEFTPVEIYADRERVEVGSGRPAELTVVLRIAEGWHIAAADAGEGEGGLEPLRVGVIGGTGVAVYADYPPGEAYGPDGRARVHKGSVELRVALEREGEWRGRPILTVRFQACSESECLEARTAELDVAVDEGR
jgi:uncharacterized protein YyaL (SSP411 family)